MMAVGAGCSVVWAGLSPAAGRGGVVQADHTGPAVPTERDRCLTDLVPTDLAQSHYSMRYYLVAEYWEGSKDGDV